MVWDLRSLCDKADYAIIRYVINRIRLYTVAEFIDTNCEDFGLLRQRQYNLNQLF